LTGSYQMQKLVGRTDKSGARGFGCWLWISRPLRDQLVHSRIRLAGRHLTCPTIIHSVDHLLSRVPPRYARGGVGSTDFADQLGRGMVDSRRCLGLARDAVAVEAARLLRLFRTSDHGVSV
jgi:hypothetical protein